MFWERLENLCNKNGIKPTSLVKKITNSSSNVTTWRKGTIPNGETLIKLADYFNVSVDYLLGRTDYPEINNGQSSQTPVSNDYTSYPIYKEFAEADKDIARVAAYGSGVHSHDNKPNDEASGKPADDSDDN